MIASLVVAAGCAPALSRLTVEAVHTEARAKTALLNDPVVGGRVINVHVVAGVAELSGRVASADEAARATEVVRAVAGVMEVQSRLVIGAAAVTPEVEPEPRADPLRGPAYELAELDDRPHRLAVGGALGWANQAGPAAGTRASLQPLLKLGSGEGVQAAIAFDWFEARVSTSPAAPLDAGAVRVRPLMAGVGYARQFGRVSLVPSLVAGYAFNRIAVPDEGAAAGLPVDVANSFVWRPGVSVWFDASRRTSLTLSVGRVFTRPRVTYVEDERLVDRHVSADTSLVLVGVAYRLF